MGSYEVIEVGGGGGVGDRKYFQLGCVIFSWVVIISGGRGERGLIY